MHVTGVGAETELLGWSCRPFSVLPVGWGKGWPWARYQITAFGYAPSSPCLIIGRTRGLVTVEALWRGAVAIRAYKRYRQSRGKRETTTLPLERETQAQRRVSRHEHYQYTMSSALVEQLNALILPEIPYSPRTPPLHSESPLHRPISLTPLHLSLLPPSPVSIYHPSPPIPAPSSCFPSSTPLRLQLTYQHLQTLLAALLPHLQSRQHQLVSEFSFWPSSPPHDSGYPDGGVFEMRSYKLYPGKLLEWETAWRRGLEARKRFVVSLLGFGLVCCSGGGRGDMYVPRRG